MAQFRKRPVVVEAVQLTWGTWGEVCTFCGVGLFREGKPEGCYLDADGKPAAPDGHDRIGLQIPTREGVMVASDGDWIIRGVAGELYSCKPDIFALTYEPVSEPAPVGAGHPGSPGRRDTLC